MRLRSGSGYESGPSAAVVDADTAFREDFLRLVSTIGVSHDRAVLLVELSTGSPFDTCTPSELLPLLFDLIALAHRTSHGSGGLACEP